MNDYERLAEDGWREVEGDARGPGWLHDDWPEHKRPVPTSVALHLSGVRDAQRDRIAEQRREVEARGHDEPTSLF